MAKDYTAKRRGPEDGFGSSGRAKSAAGSRSGARVAGYLREGVVAKCSGCGIAVQRGHLLKAMPRIN